MNPLVDSALENHDKVAALIILGRDFEGYSAKAAFDDMKLGLSHATSFSRIAIVSDKDFLRNSWDTLMHLFPAKSEGFSMDDLPEARAWVVAKD